MSAGGVVGQVDTQHHRQHQDTEQTQQQDPGSGDTHPVAAGERAAVALRRRLAVPAAGAGHGRGGKRPPAAAVLKLLLRVQSDGLERRRREIHTGSDDDICSCSPQHIDPGSAAKAPLAVLDGECSGAMAGSRSA